MSYNHIFEVACKLAGNLPQKVTKEELINHYLHCMNIRPGIANELTVVNLVQAANLVNIQVRGNSKLEVNVPLIEQWRYISETREISRKQSLRERLENNKEDIIKSYERGVTTEDMAKAWHCSVGTMNTYLKKWGANIRKRGRVKIGDGILRESGTERKRRRKAM